MNLLFSDKALRDYRGLPAMIKKAADKQFQFLLNNLMHPSLRAKKREGTPDIWQARISKDWRFYFRIDRNNYSIITIIKHPK